MLQVAEGIPIVDIHESSRQGLHALVTTSGNKLKLDLIHFIRKLFEVCLIGAWKSLQNDIDMSAVGNDAQPCKLP
jgi:hypothetical protein